MTTVGELRRKTLEALMKPSYSISRKDMVLLNDNANLFGVNPAVLEVAESFDFARLWAYPSENSDALRDRIASEYGVASDEVIVGNGSDEILDITSKCFINLAKVCEKQLERDFSLNVESLLEERAKITAICQPNNPTAVLFESKSVKRVLREAYGLVLVDEAYAEYSGSNLLQEVMDSEHALDIRTFSKAHGMAGLRVGFAIARKDVIDELRSVRTPFGLNSFAEAAAIRALDNRSWISETVARTKEERSYLARRLTALGFKVYPSDCNFLLCKAPVDGPALVSALRGEGVAIRDCNSYPLLENHVRITIGPRSMLEVLLDKIEHLFSVGSR